jgi:hypothetical protein
MTTVATVEQLFLTMTNGNLTFMSQELVVGSACIEFFMMWLTMGLHGQHVIL